MKKFNNIRKIAFLLFCAVTLCVQGQGKEGWTLSTTQRENYAGICLANGYIGLVTSPHIFGTQYILLNGIYDRGNEYDGVSSPVFAPQMMNLVFKLDGKEAKDEDMSNWKQCLDMHEAVATTEFDLPEGHVKYTQQAMRNLAYVAVMTVEFTPSKDLEMEAINQITPTFINKDPEYSYQLIADGHERIPLNKIKTQTMHNYYEIACTTAFLVGSIEERSHIGEIEYDGTKAMNLKKSLKKGETYRFALAGAVCTTRDFFNATNQASRIITALTCGGVDKALKAHKAEWARLWESDIQIEGDMQSQIDVRSCLYHLYSFVGEDNRESPSPMGLSSTGYNRHIFWDTEIWMYPPLLILNQQMAKSCVDYRFDRLERAKQRAKMLGYKGVMFPWESDNSGEEACPLWALTGALEQHITADVGIACWNYYCVTKDKKWLRESGYPLLREVAEFVCSRMEKNEDGTYSFLNVVGADEYACNVDDNAYTNGTAQVALQYALKAAKLVGEKANPLWKEVERNVKYHYFEDGIMKEHATYNGQFIKQGDVILLAYPLGLMTDKEEIKRHLEYYDKVMDPHGPAMGSSILSILSSQMGDSENAFRLWQRSYIPHKCPPFGVLSEGAGGSNPYFSTGAGGMLQAVLCGFGGLRITEKGIVQKYPCLPKEWKKLTITGVGPQKKTFTVEK